MRNVQSRKYPNELLCVNHASKDRLPSGRNGCGMMVLTRLVPALTRLADAVTLLASVTVVFDPKVARGPYTAVDQASQVARSPTLKREMQASSRHLAVRVRDATIKSCRARK